MPWTYYDAAGKPVPEKAATFRCREVSVGGSAPAPPGHGSLGAIEYHDVHAIDQPELRKTSRRECGPYWRRCEPGPDRMRVITRAISQTSALGLKAVNLR